MGFGDQLRWRRKELGISREELAKRLGITPSAVGNYETGVSFPKEEVMLRLFDCLQTDPNYLFQDSFSTGGQVLSQSERTLLTQYRGLSPVGRETVRSVVEALCVYRDELEQSRERQEDIGRAKAALNIQGRELTVTEGKYLASWLDMGFGEDCLAIAYDRTVTNTGALKWSYMNKILLSWHEKGIHTPVEVQEKDGRRRSAPPPAKAGEKAIDMDKLKSIMNTM